MAALMGGSDLGGLSPGLLAENTQLNQDVCRFRGLEKLRPLTILNSLMLSSGRWHKMANSCRTLAPAPPKPITKPTNRFNHASPAGYR